MTRSPEAPRLATNLAEVRRRIAYAAKQAGREPETITLIAVAKTFSANAIRALAEAGQRCFGESYVQEAISKQEALADLGLEWHYIGPLQSNKAGTVANRFALVHSVDRLKVARALNRHRTGKAALDICLQVNLSGEPSKSGLAPEETAHWAMAIAEDCPNLRIRGLMTLPAPDPEAAHLAFRRLATLREELRSRVPEAPWDILSMGMSADFETAIATGATHIRVGSALFGGRPSANR